MVIRCTVRFLDLEAGVMRAPGDEWEATPERLAQINGAGYGRLAEEVPAQDAGAEASPGPDAAAEAPEKPKRKRKAVS